MKKKIHLIAVLLCSSFGMINAQIDVNVEGSTEEISGQSHTVNTGSASGQEVHFLIHNLGSAEDFKITRKRMDVPAGWTDYLCWGEEGDATGGNCYSASQMNTDPWITPDVINLSTGETGALLVHFNPDDNSNGMATYRYYIGRTIDNPMDSVDLVVNANPLSVKVIKNPAQVFTAFPNPAGDFLNVTVNGGFDSYLRMTDVLGNIVFEEKISGSKKIDTESFKNGVYILSFTTNGMVYTKRIVVKH